MNYDFLRSYHIPTSTNNQAQPGYANNLYQGPCTSDGSNYTNYAGVQQPCPDNGATYSNYTIPQQPEVGYSYATLQQPPPPPTGLLDYYSGGEGTNETSVVSQPQKGSYQHPDRFIPPGRKGTNYRPAPSRPLKRKYNAGPKDNEPIVETTEDGQLVMFQGRDASYPAELNKLIHPLVCDLCTTQMNSLHSAKDHYESKAHDRNITAWLANNFTSKGLEPPEVKRLFKSGPTGPEAFHCELCDLKLTSLTHAKQHYAGRKHRLVANNVSKPSGAGYFNLEGKWVRTGTKLTTVANDDRFGIGEKFRDTETSSSSINISADAANSSSAPDTTTSADGKTPLTLVPAAVGVVKNDSLHCSVCKISVTSSGQMTMHLEGVKHRKKCKLSSDEATTPTAAQSVATIKIEPLEQAAKSILASINDKVTPDNDLSMYRTPSGSYYCSVCNVAVCHVSALQQHLIGKKHIKKAMEEKTKSTAVPQKK